MAEKGHSFSRRTQLGIPALRLEPESVQSYKICHAPHPFSMWEYTVIFEIFFSLEFKMCGYLNANA